MCGIAGYYHPYNSQTFSSSYWNEILIKMHQCLNHRGNDACGTKQYESVGLSHARLSIRDITGGIQPMTRVHNHISYSIIYNGEIYNATELTIALKNAGFTFETTSDTEVILYAFIHYGPAFVSRLNGIFSFAIWDDGKQELYLYRDRVGVKPLFYYYKNHVLVFGSEPKALFCYPAIVPSINEESLKEILAIGPARTPSCGVFCDINEVLPGHFMIISKEHLTDYTYWELSSREHIDTYPQTVDKVSFLVRDSVRRQMVSDVDVCTFLSGGIDSSIVTALAYQYRKKHNRPLNTFSFDFTGNDIYFRSNSFQPERDLPYVNIMLKYYSLNHTYLECDQKTLFDSLFLAVDAKDLPGMTDVDASLLYFCSKVSEKNKVALTGECADEIFGGYPWFYRPNLLHRDGFPWSDNIDVRTIFLKDDFISKLSLKEYAYDQYITSKNAAPLLEGESADEKARRQVAYLNIKWFMQTLLDRMDRTSMYSGLEARVPFADHRIIEYVYNVPWHMKYQNGIEKALLRDACRDLLPSKLLHRKKSPYPKTYHPLYEQYLIEKMREIANDTNAPIYPILNQEKLAAFLSAPKEYGKPWFGQLMAGPQLVAYFIQINDWMHKYHLTLP